MESYKTIPQSNTDSNDNTNNNDNNNSNSNDAAPKTSKPKVVPKQKHRE